MESARYDDFRSGNGGEFARKRLALWKSHLPGNLSLDQARVVVGGSGAVLRSAIDPCSGKSSIPAAREASRGSSDSC